MHQTLCFLFLASALNSKQTNESNRLVKFASHKKLMLDDLILSGPLTHFSATTSSSSLNQKEGDRRDQGKEQKGPRKEVHMATKTGSFLYFLFYPQPIVTSSYFVIESSSNAILV